MTDDEKFERMVQQARQLGTRIQQIEAHAKLLGITLDQYAVIMEGVLDHHSAPPDRLENLAQIAGASNEATYAVLETVLQMLEEAHPKAKAKR